GALTLDGLFAALSCTDANDLLYGGHEDLAIPNAASLGCSHNRFNDHVFQVVRDDYFYLGFGEKVNDVFGTTIEFGMAALSSEATHLTDGHTLDARGVELFLDLVQLKGFNDCFNLFHDSFSSGVSFPCRLTLPQDGSTDRMCQHYSILTSPMMTAVGPQRQREPHCDQCSSPCVISWFALRLWD